MELRGQRGQVDGSIMIGWLVDSSFHQRILPPGHPKATHPLPGFGLAGGSTKSELEPKQVFKFVGYQFDLFHLWVNPNQNRWENQFYRCHSSCLIKLVGWEFLVSDRPSHRNGKTGTLWVDFMRSIQLHLKRHWRVPESLEKEIPVPRILHPHLQ